MAEEKLGIDFFAKLAGFGKLRDAANKVDRLKKTAERTTGVFARFNRAAQKIGNIGMGMENWGGKMMMQTGLVYQAAQDLSRKFHTVVDAFSSVEVKGKELGMVLAPMGGDIKKSIDIATKSALDFSKKYSTSALEIMEATYAIAGASITDPLIAPKVAIWTAKVARSTRQDIESTANAWASAGNTFFTVSEMTEGQLERLSDVLTRTQQKYQFRNLQQLADGYKYAGTGAKNLGVSLELTSTLLGILNSTGLQGTLAGTSLKQTFLKMAGAAKKLRFDLRETSEGGVDVIDAFRQIKARVEDLPKAEKVELIRKLFGEEAMSAVLIFLDKFDQVESGLIDISNSVGVTERSFQDMEHTTKAAFAKVRNNLFALFYTMGEKLGPSLVKLSGQAVTLIGKITKFADRHPYITKIAGAFLGVGAAIAGIMIPLMTFIGIFAWGAGKILSSIRSISTGLKLVRLAIIKLNAIRVGGNITSGLSGASNETLRLMQSLRGTSGAASGLSIGIKGSLIPALTSLAVAAGPLILIAAGIAAIYGTVRAFQEKKKIDVAEESISASKANLELGKIYRKRIAMYRKLEEKKLKGTKLDKIEEKSWQRQRKWMEQSKFKKMIKYKPSPIKMPKVPGMPNVPSLSPGEVGIPSPKDITAASRPEINNYYYTTHFERESVQINTLDLSPEKFMTLLEEVIRRKSLANEPA